MYLKMKTCSKCKRELPSNDDYFNKDKNRKDGLYPQCRECRQNRKIFAKENFKICKQCQKELPKNTDYFLKNKEASDGFMSGCKECKGHKYTNKLSKIPKENHKFCIKCDRELPSTFQYFPPDKNCKDGIRNVCRECGKDGHFMEDGYTPKKWWTDEEEKLLAKVYPHYLNSELIETYFPDKTEKDLWDKVYILNKEKGYKIAKSEDTVKRRHENQSIKMSGENSPLFGIPKTIEHRKKLSEARKGRFVGVNSYWFGRKRSSEQVENMRLIMKEKGKWKGINNPRHQNPLTKEKNGRWKGGISELHAHLRRYIKPWKDDSMKQCNYRCVLTNGEFNNVHHLINFSYIIDETMKIVNLPIHEQISIYSTEELRSIENVCLDLHYQLGLGVCLRKDIHKLFHDLYGYSNNTQEQFEEFKLRFRLGEFKEII